MNSGKYLYKVPNEKKVQITKKVNVRKILYLLFLYIIFFLQKPQLKYINHETIIHFKKFMAKLYKKDEETCLNKKKKREEVKQKNKNEKTRVNNRNGNQNGYNQYTNFYQGFYLPPPMQPMNNQNTPMDYQYYYFNNPYQLPPHLYAFPQYMQQYIMGPPKTLQENLNSIYERGIVNNIIGAFFIKEQQEKMKNNEKRQVPISTVEIADEQANNSNSNNANENTINNKNENEKSTHSNDNNKKKNNEEKNGEEKNENNDEENENEEKKSIEEDKEEKKDNGIYEQNNINNINELKKPDIIYQINNKLNIIIENKKLN